MMPDHPSLRYQRIFGESGSLVELRLTPAAGFAIAGVVLKQPILESQYSVLVRRTPEPGNEADAVPTLDLKRLSDHQLATLEEILRAAVEDRLDIDGSDIAARADNPGAASR